MTEKHIKDFVNTCISDDLVIEDDMEYEFKLKNLNLVKFKNIDKLFIGNGFNITIDLLFTNTNNRYQYEIRDYFTGNKDDYICMKKEHVNDNHNDEIGVKFSISKETKVDSIIDNEKGDCIIRLKNRKTIGDVENGVQYDLSIVKTLNVKNFDSSKIYTDILNEEETYEVEMELFKVKINKECKNNISYSLYNLLKHCNDSKFFMTTSDAKKIQSEVLELLNGSKDKSFSIKDNKCKNLPKVLNLSHNDLNVIKNAHVLEKTDGIHSFLYSSNNILYLLNDDFSEVNNLGKINFENIKSPQIFLIEGELVELSNNILHFYVFDVIYINGFKTNEPFIQRMKSLDIFTSSYKSLTYDVMYNNNMKICKKEICVNSKECQLYTKGINPSSEGFIFIVDPKDKNKYVNQKIYKWKYLDKLSIDFLVRKHVVSYINKEIELYSLFVRDKKEIIPFKINNVEQYFVNSEEIIRGMETKEKTLIENCVYEFIYKDKKWVPTRFRSQKTSNNNPNAQLTAIGVWSTINKPILISDLNSQSNSYYRSSTGKGKSTGTSSERDDLIDSMAWFNRLCVKEYLYKQCTSLIKKNEIHMYEIGYGQGGDLNRINDMSNKFKISLDGTDNGNNLDNFMSRFNDLSNKNLHIGELKTDKFTENSMKKNYDIISGQFSIHYTINDFKSVHGFMNYIKMHLETGGLFIGTTLDSDSINGELEGGSDLVEMKDDKSMLIEKYNDDIVWSIELKEDEQINDGIFVDVKIPSKSITEISNERVLSMSTFKKICEDLKLKVILCDNFSNFSEYDSKSFNSYYNGVKSEKLKKYIGLNFAFIVQKV